MSQSIIKFTQRRSAVKPFYKSKKFWTMALGALAAILADTIGLEIPPETIALLAAYIVGQGLADRADGRSE